MGTPNSDIYKEAYENFALTGEAPTVRTMYDLGMDYEFLSQRVDAIKPQLPYMDSLAPLESFPVHEQAGDRSRPWVELVKESALIGTRCLRFDEEIEGFNRQKYRTPAFSVMRRLDRAVTTSSSIEIFLRRDGAWVIYTGAMLYMPEPTISVFETTQEVFDMFNRFQTEGHVMYSDRYRSLSFWPRPGDVAYGNDQILPMGFALLLHLSLLLEQSIAAKEKRLATQRELLDKFNVVESRNGLILDTLL